MTKVEKLVNFRDLGGYKNHEGKLVQPKKLLRSGEVVAIGEADSKVLIDSFNLKHIIDLRGEKEISEKPDDELAGVAYTNIDIMKATTENAASQKGMMDELSPEAADRRMNELYQELILSDSAITGYQKFVQLALENTEGSLLFHCFAGKDRTGFGAALLLELLGVDRQDIMKDYLLTNVQRAAANSLILADGKAKGLNEIELQGLNYFMSVKPEYLETSWATIAKEFGTFSDYTSKGLKLSPGDQKDLRQIYLG